MHAATFVLVAAAVMILALRRTPSRARGILHGAVGVVVLASAGYAWFLALWFGVVRLTAVFDALSAPGLRWLGLIVFWLPPAALAAAAVLLMGRAPRP